ncbi:hypothetical protein ACFWYX_28295 [[Kitasatospora] papulosa]
MATTTLPLLAKVGAGNVAWRIASRDRSEERRTLIAPPNAR